MPDDNCPVTREICALKMDAITTEIVEHKGRIFALETALADGLKWLVGTLITLCLGGGFWIFENIIKKVGG